MRQINASAQLRMILKKKESVDMSQSIQVRSVTGLMSAGTARRSTQATGPSIRSAFARESRRMKNDGLAVEVQGIVFHHGHLMQGYTL